MHYGPAKSSAQTGISSFRPDVEGLRAIAILLVALYHAGLPYLPGGFVGVDLFFVLSGFLITGLLVKEIESTGTVNFASFYARRARRLIPAAAFIVVATLLVAQFIYAPQELVALTKDAITTSLYASNLWFAHISTDYLAAGAEKSPLLHTWSLSVEEQFYFVWPLFLLWALRGRKGQVPSRQRLIGIMVALALVSLAAAEWLTHLAQPWAFFASPTRAWEFAVGGLAWFVPTRWWAERPRLRQALFWGGLLMLMGAAIGYGHETVFPGVTAMLPVAGGALMLVSHVPGQSTTAERLLRHPVMQWLGSRSYSWYLWHWPVLILAGRLVPEKTLAMNLGCIALALLLAEACYRFVENPLRFSPLLARRPAYSISFAITLTLVSAASAGWWRYSGDLESHSPEQISFTQAMADVPREIYGTTCHLSLLDTQTGECVFGDKDATTTVVLFGDSHAAQWFPAMQSLAKQHNWKLVSLTKSACPVASVVPVNRQLGRLYTECAEWREQTLEKIIALRPAMVVMGYYRYVSLPDESLEPISQTRWREGMRDTLARFDAAGVPVAVMRDNPRPGFDVPRCLARQAKQPWLDLDCSFSRQPSLDSVEYALIREAARDLAHVRFVDMSDDICADNHCTPMDDSGIVWFRDDHHLTTAAVKQLAPNLSDALVAAMVAE